MIDRRQFLSMAAALSAPRKMNVLFIVADDMNTALGCYGNHVVQTPHLDRLAAEGTRFDRAYCQFPLCAPSRASFLSGRRPETTRVWTLTTPTRQNLQDAVMLPEFFRQNGYYTAQVGKIYHTGKEHEDPRSWDFSLEESGKNPAASEIAAEYEMAKPRNHSMSWAKLKTADADTPDGLVVHKAAEIMRKCAAENRPFFVGAGFRRPHSPYAVPQKYFDLYDPAKMPLPKTGNRKGLPESAWYELANQPALTERETREFIAAYYACNSYVDAQVGALMAALDESKLRDNTAVVFIGDHGYHNGEHGMWHKMTLFEQSARAPLIARVPGARNAGKPCRGLVEFIDIYPTLADVCGLKAPSGLEGMSLKALLDDPSRPGKAAAYTMVGRNENRANTNKEATYFGRSVRTERWRYTEWDGGKRGVELYDERGDPGELHNLAPDRAHAAVIREMARRLNRID